MRIPFTLSVLLFLTSCGVETTQTIVLPTVEVSEDPVEAFLDAGGVQYAITSGQYEWDAIAPTIELFTSSLAIGLRTEESVPPLLPDWIKDLPLKVGLDEVVRRGSSTIEHPSGGYLSKTALERKPDADGILWKLNGDEFDLRTELNRLPKETAFMLRVTMNAPWILESGKKTATDLVPQVAEPIQQAEAMVAMTGFPLQDVLQAIKGGITFALFLNEDETWTVPIPGVSSIPQTGFVLMLDDPEANLHRTLLSLIEAQVPAPFQPVVRTTDEVDIHRFLGIPLPVSIIPQIAHLQGRLVITTDDIWMEQMIANVDCETPSPLLALLKDIEDTRAHQAWVMGDGLQKVATTVMEENFKQMREELGDEMIPESLTEQYMANFLDFYPHVGLLHQGETLSTSLLLHQKPLLAHDKAKTVLVAPAAVGLLAAIGIPAFSQAREMSQENISINQMRLIQAAKDQWALENNQPLSATPTWEDLMPYLEEKPVCPDGGEYTIGSVGEPVSCSIYGVLP